MLIKKLRLQRGWSQEQLAEISGLSSRTIQRIERGENASLETLKSLASVFEVDVSDLTDHYKIQEHEEPVMQDDTKLTYDEAKAIEEVKEIKGFYLHLGVFIFLVPFLIGINLLTSPQYHWFWWPILGLSFGLVAHGVSLFVNSSAFGANWEKRQIEKRLGRKL
ncbi:MAG: helix-turn-helix domain-containing protein [Gammaproteobacteria bacterium]|nr:helix-turn-helix domain-containing protein [Gammaproteobacteria bacterium]